MSILHVSILANKLIHVQKDMKYMSSLDNELILVGNYETILTHYGASAKTLVQVEASKLFGNTRIGYNHVKVAETYFPRSYLHSFLIGNIGHMFPGNKKSELTKGFMNYLVTICSIMVRLTTKELFIDHVMSYADCPGEFMTNVINILTLTGLPEPVNNVPEEINLAPVKAQETPVINTIDTVDTVDLITELIGYYNDMTGPAWKEMVLNDHRTKEIWGSSLKFFDSWELYEFFNNYLRKTVTCSAGSYSREYKKILEISRAVTDYNNCKGIDDIVLWRESNLEFYKELTGSDKEDDAYTMASLMSVMSDTPLREINPIKEALQDTGNVSLETVISDYKTMSPDDWRKKYAKKYMDYMEIDELDQVPEPELLYEFFTERMYYCAPGDDMNDEIEFSIDGSSYSEVSEDDIEDPENGWYYDDVKIVEEFKIQDMKDIKDMKTKTVRFLDDVVSGYSEDIRLSEDNESRLPDIMKNPIVLGDIPIKTQSKWSFIPDNLYIPMNTTNTKITGIPGRVDEYGNAAHLMHRTIDNDDVD